MRLDAMRPVLFLLLVPAFAGCDSESTPTRVDFTETVADSFTVAAAGSLSVQHFAGSLDMRPAGPGKVRVTATKRARRQDDLQEIQLDMAAATGGVRIVTENPHHVQNVSVDLAITAPANLLPRISVGAGPVRYEGRPAGSWIFAIGAGDLTLVLPADVNTSVDLSVGAGSITTEFAIAGTVTANTAVGTIGSGGPDRIMATVGAGRIQLIRQ